MTGSRELLNKGIGVYLHALEKGRHGCRPSADTASPLSLSSRDPQNAVDAQWEILGQQEPSRCESPESNIGSLTFGRSSGASWTPFSVCAARRVPPVELILRQQTLDTAPDKAGAVAFQSHSLRLRAPLKQYHCPAHRSSYLCRCYVDIALLPFLLQLTSIPTLSEHHGFRRG